jgi:hypothetical protein
MVVHLLAQAVPGASTQGRSRGVRVAVSRDPLQSQSWRAAGHADLAWAVPTDIMCMMHTTTAHAQAAATPPRPLRAHTATHSPSSHCRHRSITMVGAW